MNNIKYSLIFFLCLLKVMPAVAQRGPVPLCQNRTVTTRWDSPQSTNSWNWSLSYYEAYIKNRPQPTTIASPFFTPYNTFQNQNIIFLQNPSIKDCQPSDGWELLVKDFGNNSNLPATAVTNPFFALYNKYSSIIRVFFLVSDPLSGTNNGATVSLQFDKSGLNESALLAHAQPIMNSTNRFTKDVYASA